MLTTYLLGFGAQHSVFQCLFDGRRVLGPIRNAMFLASDPQFTAGTAGALGSAVAR